MTFSKNRKIDIAINVILALLVELALHARFYVIENWGQECFSSAGFTDVVCVAGLYFLIGKVREKSNKLDISLAILSLIFGFIFVMTKSFHVYDSMLLFTAGVGQLVFTGLCVTGLSVLFYILLSLLIYLLESNMLLNRAGENIEEKNLKIISVVLPAICWLPWILLNIPGTFLEDAYDQIRQFMGVASWDAEHPLVSTFIMGFLFKVGVKLGSPNLGIVLYLILNIVVGAFFVQRLLLFFYRWNLSKKFIVSVLLFFSVLPLWGALIQWLEKDFLYSLAIAGFAMILADIVLKKECSKRDMCNLLIVGALGCVLRTNGVYVVIISFFVALFVKGIKNKSRLIVSFLIISLGYFCYTKTLYTALDTEVSARGGLSIPFQQTARYMLFYPGEVTDEEYEVIDTVLDAKNIASLYNAKLADPVLFTYKWDDSKLPEYFKVWFEMLKKHPRVYIDACLNVSYGYFAPIDTDVQPRVDIKDIEWGWPYFAEVGVERINPKGGLFLKNILDFNTSLPLLRHLVEPGFYVWLMIFSTFMLFRKKKYDLLVVLLPSYITWGFCIISPLVNSVRYELPIFVAAPILMALPIINKDK